MIGSIAGESDLFQGTRVEMSEEAYRLVVPPLQLSRQSIFPSF